MAAGDAWTQEPDVAPRFDVIYNPDLYNQTTPKETLKSVLGAIARGRFDYIVAHLLDPAYVDASLGGTQTYFERVAAEQIAATTAGRILRDAALQTRVREVGTQLNARHLAEQIRRKIEDEPDNLKDLKRFAREGLIQSGGETASATLRDVKDRGLYFKKVGSRWFLENRKEAAKE